MLTLPMSPDGHIAAYQDELIEATGLPERTFKRHLARAVAAGWLSCETRGGNGRPSVYRAIIPPSCRPLVAHNSTSCGPPTTHNSGGVVGHVVAHSIRDSASVSEHEAVDAPDSLFETPAASSNGKSAPTDNGFDEWYAAYPRKASPLKAATAYAKAIKAGVSADVLLKGALRYRDDPNRSPQFTKMPTTWLNQGCWDDDPEPPRRDASRTTGAAAVGLTQEHYADDPNDPMYSL